MTSMKTAQQGRRWGSTRQGAKLLGVPIGRVRKLIHRGQVATLNLPGSRQLIDLDELQRIARESVSPAETA
jgi:hypothetical protein